jgi:predicted TIM-barrel fold metal-dependent hydrolase
VAADLAKLANDRAAEIIERHPGRFAALAAFPPQDPAAAVREMERAINTLKLNGFIVNSHTNDEYLDDKKYWPILEAAEALQRPLYIHPRGPSAKMADAYRLQVLYGPIWGFQAEVSVHIMRMILGRVFDRFPKLKVVIGHMGESIPFNLWRADYWYRPSDGTTFSDVFKRNIAITTSGAVSHPIADAALKLTIQAVGAENVMWAPDYPFQPNDIAVKWMDTVDIPEEQRELIYHGNAERLFHIAPKA